VFTLFQQIIDGLVVNKERALAEVNADYSTTTEIADALLQRADVPFRIGHHFASRLTDYGRGKGLTLHEVPYAEAARIYEADTKQNLPLDEAAYREIISAEYSVFSRRGTGGPQPAEVQRMLVDERAKAAADRKWHGDASARLANAAATLDQAFNKLAGGM
jgi:argininosuccinate lyase